jgi:hypothetical protein
MSGNIKSVSFCKTARSRDARKVPSDFLHGVILQGNFRSEAAREEFRQTVADCGTKRPYHQRSSQQVPDHVSGAFERISRALDRFLATHANPEL